MYKIPSPWARLEYEIFFKGGILNGIEKTSDQDLVFRAIVRFCLYNMGGV
jgi:hypothetical protein